MHELQWRFSGRGIRKMEHGIGGRGKGGGRMDTPAPMIPGPPDGLMGAPRYFGVAESGRGARFSGNRASEWNPEEGRWARG